MFAMLLYFSSLWSLPPAVVVEPPKKVHECTTKSREMVLPIVAKSELFEVYKQIHVLVSSDEGKSWKKIADVTPQTKSVNFKAPGDGVYWFSLLHIAKDGKTLPADPTQFKPDLIVRVKDSKEKMPVDPGLGSWRLETKAGKDKKITRTMELTLGPKGAGRLTIEDSTGGPRIITLHEFTYFLDEEKGKKILNIAGGTIKKFLPIPYVIENDQLCLKGGAVFVLVGEECSLEGRWTKLTPAAK